ncbi:MAG: hypothetical protein WBV73_17470 [Phormidium sp.]
METFFESSQIVLDFKTLLKVEQAKENSDLFDTTVWQDLTKLDRVLDTVSKPPEIADVILDWCEQNPQIEQLFKNTDWAKVRCDMDDECETDDQPNQDNPPIDILENKYEIQRIIRDNQPNNPANNSPS